MPRHIWIKQTWYSSEPVKYAKYIGTEKTYAGRTKPRAKLVNQLVCTYRRNSREKLHYACRRGYRVRYGMKKKKKNIRNCRHALARNSASPSVLAVIGTRFNTRRIEIANLAPRDIQTAVTCSCFVSTWYPSVTSCPFSWTFLKWSSHQVFLTLRRSEISKSWFLSFDWF